MLWDVVIVSLLFCFKRQQKVASTICCFRSSSLSVMKRKGYLEVIQTRVRENAKKLLGKKHTFLKARHFDASDAETIFVGRLWYVPVTFDVSCGQA